MTDKPKDQVLDSLIEKLKDHFAEASVAKQKLENTKEKIKNHLEMKKMNKVVHKGVTITKVTTKGKINYADIPQLQGVNLDKFRGDSSTTWRMQMSKDEKQ